jgi:hypothetical protein
MTDIDHDHAITTITETLGGTVVSLTFQMYPDRFFDQANGAGPRRQPVSKGAPIGERFPPAEPDRPIIDWSTHRTSGQPAPCIHCTRPALLLDDAGRPAHKVCAEAALAQLLQTDQGSAA